MKATPFEMSKLPEDVLPYIPGYCFVDLLISYEDETILDGKLHFDFIILIPNVPTFCVIMHSCNM